MIDGKICLNNPCEPPSKKQNRITIGIIITGTDLGLFMSSKTRRTNASYKTERMQRHSNFT